MRSFFRKLVAPPKERPPTNTGMTFIVIGAIIGAFLFILFILPTLIVELYWEDCRCTVLDGRVAKSGSSDEAMYRPEILIRYEYKGNTFETWSTRAGGAHSDDNDDTVEEIKRYAPGQSYTCRVNPEKPAEAVVLRELPNQALLLLFPLIFIAVGIRSIYYTFTLRNKSPEQIRQYSQEGGTTTCIPSAPSEPGAHLPFRLRYEKDVGGSVILLVLALFLSFFEACLLVVVATAKIEGFAAVVLLFFILVVGLMALLMWIEITTKARIALRVPPAILEVSTSPVRPGVPFDLFIEQPKPAQFSTYAVKLVCEESATCNDDSDSSKTEKRDVYEQSIVTAQPLSEENHQSFVHRSRVVLPANAMHSLDAPHNKITWKLVIAGNSTTGGEFRRDVLLIVHPPKPERAAGYRDTPAS
jgi:Protein of unknown function (DUF3592)